nr:MAG TPA: hypothetical protein [Caudoviricetes sp.]
MVSSLSLLRSRDRISYDIRHVRLQFLVPYVFVNSSN